MKTQKTHCPKGHEYTPENTVVKLREHTGPLKICKTCSNRYRSSFNPWHKKTSCKQEKYVVKDTLETAKGDSFKKLND